MGCPKDVVAGSLRFSLGAATTAAVVDLAVQRIIKTVIDLRAKKESGKIVPTARHGSSERV
jgi:cysteine sulfinate desulfinase/cysteine desulfurase-like protein